MHYIFATQDKVEEFGQWKHAYKAYKNHGGRPKMVGSVSGNIVRGVNVTANFHWADGGEEIELLKARLALNELNYLA